MSTQRQPSGIAPLTEEFTVSKNPWDGILDLEKWQMQTTANAIYQCLGEKFGCSDNTKVWFWPKGNSGMIVKLAIEKSDTLPTPTCSDRLNVQKFIAELVSLKREEDELYITRQPEEDSCSLSFKNSDMVSLLKKIVGNIPELQEVRAYLEKSQALHERQSNIHRPQFNN